MEPVPEGPYIVAITDGKLKPTKAGDKEMIAWEFTVQEGEFAGRKLFTNSVLTDECLWSLMALCEAAGKPIPKGELDFDPLDYFGCQLVVNAIQKEYPEGSGKMTNNVNSFAAYEPSTSRRKK
jgi:hypothetical protein